MEEYLAIRDREWGQQITQHEIDQKAEKRKVRESVQLKSKDKTMTKQIAGAILLGVIRTRVFNIQQVEDLKKQQRQPRQSPTSPQRTWKPPSTIHRTPSPTLVTPTPPDLNSIQGASFIPTPPKPRAKPPKKKKTEKTKSATPQMPSKRKAPPTLPRSLEPCSDLALREALEDAFTEREQGMVDNSFKRSCGGLLVQRPVRNSRVMLRKRGVSFNPKVVHSMFTMTRKGSLVPDDMMDTLAKVIVKDGLGLAELYLSLQQVRATTMTCVDNREATKALKYALNWRAEEQKRCGEDFYNTVRYKCLLSFSSNVIMQLFCWVSRARAATAKRRKLLSLMNARTLCKSFNFWARSVRAMGHYCHQLLRRCFVAWRSPLNLNLNLSLSQTMSLHVPARLSVSPRFSVVAMRNKKSKAVVNRLDVVTAPFHAWATTAKMRATNLESLMKQFQKRSCFSFADRSVVWCCFIAMRDTVRYSTKTLSQQVAVVRNKGLLRRSMRAMRTTYMVCIANQQHQKKIVHSALQLWRYELYQLKVGRILAHTCAESVSLLKRNHAWDTWRTKYLRYVALRTQGAVKQTQKEGMLMPYVLILLNDNRKHAVMCWKNWRFFVTKRKRTASYFKEAQMQMDRFVLLTLFQRWRGRPLNVLGPLSGSKVLYYVEKEMEKNSVFLPHLYTMELMSQMKTDAVCILNKVMQFMRLQTMILKAQQVVLSRVRIKNQDAIEEPRTQRPSVSTHDTNERPCPLQTALHLNRVPSTTKIDLLILQNCERVKKKNHVVKELLDAAQKLMRERGAVDLRAQLIATMTANRRKQTAIAMVSIASFARTEGNIIMARNCQLEPETRSLPADAAFYFPLCTSECLGDGSRRSSKCDTILQSPHVLPVESKSTPWYPASAMQQSCKPIRHSKYKMQRCALPAPPTLVGVLVPPVVSFKQHITYKMKPAAKPKSPNHMEVLASMSPDSSFTPSVAADLTDTEPSLLL